MLTDQERYRLAYLAVTQMGEYAMRMARHLAYGDLKQSQVDTAMNLSMLLSALHVGFEEELLTEAEESALYTAVKQITYKEGTPTFPDAINSQEKILWKKPVDFFDGDAVSTISAKLALLSNYNVLVYRDPNNPSVS
tara:strand:- start:1097 stop:1507 length:411 start_codon:yes stop_codon:yes gene_type:complete